SPQPGHHLTSWSDLKSFIPSFWSACGTRVSEVRRPAPLPVAACSTLASPASLGLGIGNHILDDAAQLASAEPQGPEPGLGNYVGQERAAQDERELAGVDLGDEHFVVPLEHVAEVRREW